MESYFYIVLVKRQKSKWIPTYTGTVSISASQVSKPRQKEVASFAPSPSGLCDMGSKAHTPREAECVEFQEEEGP